MIIVRIYQLSYQWFSQEKIRIAIGVKNYSLKICQTPNIFDNWKQIWKESFGSRNIKSDESGGVGEIKKHWGGGEFISSFYLLYFLKLHFWNQNCKKRWPLRKFTGLNEASTSLRPYAFFLTITNVRIIFRNFSFSPCFIKFLLSF